MSPRDCRREIEIIAQSGDMESANLHSTEHEERGVKVKSQRKVYSLSTETTVLLRPS